MDIDEWDSNDLEKVMSDPFFKDITTVLINGNYGDIIMHSDPKSIINVFLKRGLTVDINTNGGALGSEFWKWLGEQPNVTVRFGIDGLSDTHHLYRRNTNFSKVIQNAKTFIDAGGNARWVMTLFKHNAHQVQECEELAKTLGFSQFFSRESMRFSAKKLSVSDKKFNHLYYLEPYDENNQTITQEVADYDHQWYEMHKNREIVKTMKHPKVAYDDEILCIADVEDSVFLSYDKRLWPCCHTAIGFEQAYKHNTMHDSLIDIFKDDLSNDYYFNNVLHHTIDEIVNTKQIFKKIENTWNTPNVCTSCAMNCKHESFMYKEYQSSKLTNISEK